MLTHCYSLVLVSPRGLVAVEVAWRFWCLRPRSGNPGRDRGLTYTKDSIAKHLLETRSQGRVSVDYSSVLQVCLSRVMVSSDWSVTGRGSFVTTVGPGFPTWFCCFFGPGAEIKLRP